MSFPGAKRRANDLTTRLSCCDWEPMSFFFFWLFLFLFFFLFSFVFLFCILIKRGERPTWQLAWLRAKVNFVLFSCFYFWICFCFVLYFLSALFERREQPTWLPGRPSWCDWEPMSLRGWYQTQRRKKNFEFFNFFLLKPNCYECKKWLKERGQTIQIGLPTVGEQIIQIYSVSSLVVPKMEEGISGTGAVKNSKWPDKSW